MVPDANEIFTRWLARLRELDKQFDALVEKGDTAAEALGKIGKDFDLSSAPGIRDATLVLDGLVAQGKITATQFRDAWASALKDVNLAEFEVRARQALSNTQEDAQRLQQALADYLGSPVQLRIELADNEVDTPAATAGRQRQEQQERAASAIARDGFVRDAIDTLGASIVESSIKPIA